MGGAISSLDAENLDLFDCFPHVDKFALVVGIGGNAPAQMLDVGDRAVAMACGLLARRGRSQLLEISGFAGDHIFEGFAPQPGIGLLRQEAHIACELLDEGIANRERHRVLFPS